jgi:hypothetical protein
VVEAPGGHARREIGKAGRQRVPAFGGELREGGEELGDGERGRHRERRRRLPDARIHLELGIRLGEVGDHGVEAGQQGHHRTGHVDPVEADRARGRAVVLPHPLQLGAQLRPQPHQRRHAVRHDVAELAFATSDPVVGQPSFDESGLQRVGAEPVAFDQVAQQAVAELVELAVVVAALADRHHPRVADRLVEPVEVVQRPGRVERAQRDHRLPDERDLLPDRGTPAARGRPPVTRRKSS